MKKGNKLLLAAGIISSLTTLLHLIGGQLTLVKPLNMTSLERATKTEWLGAWHMVSFVLTITSVILIQSGLNQMKYSIDLIKFITLLNVAFVIAFVVAILLNMTFVPQWILFFPVAVLCYFGSRKVSDSRIIDPS